MNAPDTVTQDDVLRIAACARLPLSPERAARVATVLDAWARDAAALSEKMSAPEHATLVPATVFVHPSAPEGE